MSADNVRGQLDAANIRFRAIKTIIQASFGNFARTSSPISASPRRHSGQIVVVHVLFGLACTITGSIAMLSQKRTGRHPLFGTIYYWCLLGVFVTASALAAVRWAEDYHLFILGTLAFAAASLGRMARRRRWNQWFKLHIIGMGTSYILLLTAFYADNGKNLPLWRDLPPITYWLVAAVVGIPLIIRALLWHPLARTPQPPSLP
jgi:uncharacterized membrane protein